MVTVYEYLTQARKTGLRIQRLEARRHGLLSSLLPAATVYDKPRVQSSPSDPMPEIMAEADELAGQIRDLERMEREELEKQMAALEGYARTRKNSIKTRKAGEKHEDQN